MLIIIPSNQYYPHLLWKLIQGRELDFAFDDKHIHKTTKRMHACMVPYISCSTVVYVCSGYLTNNS